MFFSDKINYKRNICQIEEGVERLFHGAGNRKGNEFDLNNSITLF
jgi:hypothetical protein